MADSHIMSAKHLTIMNLVPMKISKFQNLMKVKVLKMMLAKSRIFLIYRFRHKKLNLVLDQDKQNLALDIVGKFQMLNIMMTFGELRV